jgi:hypothetical protein
VGSRLLAELSKLSPQVFALVQLHAHALDNEEMSFLSTMPRERSNISHLRFVETNATDKTQGQSCDCSTDLSGKPLFLDKKINNGNFPT